MAILISGSRVGDCFSLIVAISDVVDSLILSTQASN